jgi:hypothetical protein
MVMPLRAVLTIGAAAVLASCSAPVNTFVIENTCNETVAVNVSPAGQGARGFQEVQSGGLVTVEVPAEHPDVVFDVGSDLASGSPELSYVEFNIGDLSPDAEGVYHLTVGPDCEAVQP